MTCATGAMGAQGTMGAQGAQGAKMQRSVNVLCTCEHHSNSVTAFASAVQLTPTFSSLELYVDEADLHATRLVYLLAKTNILWRTFVKAMDQIKKVDVKKVDVTRKKSETVVTRLAKQLINKVVGTRSVSVNVADHCIELATFVCDIAWYVRWGRLRHNLSTLPTFYVVFSTS